MKLKGINPLEQHVEQIVLVTVSGIFLLVVAAQFLLEPNRVKVANQSLSPGKAFDPSAEKAQRLQAIMTRTDVELPEVPPVDIADQFRQRLSGPVAPQATLAAFGKGLQLDVVESGPQLGAQLVTVPDLPAPTPLAAAAYRMTFDPMETIGNEELKRYLPAEQPMDKAVVSVEATLNGPALRTAFASSAKDARAMPEIWWTGTAIMGVRLEREELDEGGNWTGLTEVPAPPGLFDGVTAAAEASGAQISEVVFPQVRAAQDEVMRPAFYRTIAGPEWTPPTEASRALGGDNPEVTRRLRQRQQLSTQRESVARQLDAIEPGAGGGQRQGGQQGGGSGGKGGATGSGGLAPPPSSGQQASTNPRKLQLERQLADVDRRLQDIDTQLRNLGFDETGKPIQRETAAEGGDRQDRQGFARSLFSENALRLWNHDLTAEPGKTYRYRVKVALSNPAFGRGASLLPEQQELAKQPVVWTQASEWTAPVLVPADRYYFITSASEASALGPATARAEVFQFFYGYYRRGTVGLEPGDTIYATVKLPDASSLLIWDLAEAAGGQDIQPVGDPGGEGGRGMAPGVGGRGFDLGQPQQAAELPANAKPWDKPVISREDVILLDVARRPGESSTVALLRAKSGEVIQITPDQDPHGIQKLVSESAKVGETQGQPVLAPAEEPRQPRPIDRPQQEPRQPPGTPSPGGGGGAGGG
jgi:hypothetical protein